MTDYMRVTLTPRSCGDRPKQIRIQIETTKNGVFALHRDVDGRDGWTITHVLSGQFIQRGMTKDDAATLFLDLATSKLNWHFATPDKMSEDVKVFGRTVRQQYPDRFASVRDRRRAG